ncbi:MAG: lipid-A-disaccharide synthase [Candidatus Aminicenantales bacterium]
MSTILIIAGENSGEKYGARLVHEFRKIHPAAAFFGIGGEEMEKQGVHLLFSVKELALIGGFEVITHLPRLKRIFDRLKKEIELRKPAASVLIDSPDFNLRLAKILKMRSIPVLYYISPTVWAWRKARLKTIKKTVDKMILIFPFEKKIYDEHQIPSVYVGHPLKEMFSFSLSREDFLRKHNLDPSRRIIAILPGSRRSELKFHMPVLLEASERIQKRFDVQFLLLKAETLDRQLISSFLPSKMGGIRILDEDKHEAMREADLILAACGTANLEACLLQTPLISFYRIFPLTYLLGRPFVHIKSYSIVNILAGKRIVPELIQWNFTPENILQETERILNSADARKEMIHSFQAIKKLLGDLSASENAAKELAAMIQPP